MQYCLDLHNHSPLIPTDYRGPSDTTPHEFIHAALAAGLDVLGLTDHCSFDWYRRAHEAAQDVHAETGLRLLVLPGAELKIRWEADEVHLIVFFDPDHFEERFSTVFEALGVVCGAYRSEELPRIVVEHDPVEVARLVHSIGGMCHVGHADRWFGSYRLLGRPLLERLIDEAPIAAVEFIDPTNAAELGRCHEVACISSSDSHGNHEIGQRCSELEFDELSFSSLREALLGKRVFPV